MTVNVTATWRMIRSVDPLLRLSEAGRAIVVSSSVAHKVKPYWGGYATSKAAIDMLTRVWAAENAKTTRALLKRIDAVSPLAQPLQAMLMCSGSSSRCGNTRL